MPKINTKSTNKKVPKRTAKKKAIKKTIPRIRPELNLLAVGCNFNSCQEGGIGFTMSSNQFQEMIEYHIGLSEARWNADPTDHQDLIFELFDELEVFGMEVPDMSNPTESDSRRSFFTVFSNLYLLTKYEYLEENDCNGLEFHWGCGCVSSRYRYTLEDCIEN